MPPLVAVGRVLFVLLFVVSGASKLMDITGTTAEIAAKVVPAIPVVAASYVKQVEGLTAMPFAQLLAILAGVLEVVGGLLIALNIGTRFFATLLVLFVIAATYFFHDFWNQAGADKLNNMIHALKNLSIIGGLLILIGYPSGVADERGYTSAPDNRY